MAADSSKRNNLVWTSIPQRSRLRSCTRCGRQGIYRIIGIYRRYESNKYRLVNQSLVCTGCYSLAKTILKN